MAAVVQKPAPASAANSHFKETSPLALSKETSPSTLSKETSPLALSKDTSPPAPLRTRRGEKGCAVKASTPRAESGWNVKLFRYGL